MWSSSSASDPSPLMSRSHICYHSLYALHSIMLLLLVIMMIRIKIEEIKIKLSSTSNPFSIFKKKLLKHCLLTELWCKVEWGGWEGRTNKDSVCPHFSSFLILISQLSSGFNMHKMSYYLYFLQNINWNCLHSRSQSDTTLKCLGRWKRSPNITWDCENKKCVCKHYKRFSRQL